LAKAEKALESQNFEEARKNLDMIKEYRLAEKVDLECRIMYYDSYKTEEEESNRKISMDSEKEEVKTGESKDKE
jgi:hypothetical protein